VTFAGCPKQVLIGSQDEKLMKTGAFFLAMTFPKGAIIELAESETMSLATSCIVAMSLVVHVTLVHIRFGS
jgi:hypothetical protein